jgi:serine/threonine protein kinase
MKFKKIRVLGKGSYGIVYLIKDLDTDKKYALKKISYTKDYKNTMNELKILKMVDSEYIIKIKEYFRKGDYLYIIMEYAPYGDLDEYIKIRKLANKKIKPENIKKIICSIVNGLRDLHNLKIIHRDIKPSNILICKDMKIKLTDFGISKIVGNQYAVYTKIGTPYYMSPEILTGKGYSYPIDYWGLGCIVYEMLTFKKPFEANSLAQLYNKIIYSDYKKYNIKYEYKKLVEGLLNRKPLIRFNNEKVIKFFNLKINNNLNNSLIGNYNVIKKKHQLKNENKVNLYFDNIEKTKEKKLIKNNNNNILPSIKKPRNYYYQKKYNPKNIVNNKYNNNINKYKNIPKKLENNRYKNNYNKMKPYERLYNYKKKYNVKKINDNYIFHRRKPFY